MKNLFETKVIYYKMDGDYIRGKCLAIFREI